MFDIRMYRVALIVVVMILFSGCTIKKQDHGYDFDAESLKSLKINSSSKESVRKNLGSPSAVSSFDKNIWYYIALQTKNIAILKPKINRYKVLELKFKKDTLSEMVLYTNDKVRRLDPKNWESPVRGNNNNAFQDFLYNIGRFNKPIGKK